MTFYYLILFYLLFLVCKEALEVLTMTLVLNPTALEDLLEDKKWTNFIIDLVLLCNNR